MQHYCYMLTVIYGVMSHSHSSFMIWWFYINIPITWMNISWQPVVHTVDTCAHSSCQKFLAGCFGILSQKVEVTVVTWRFKWAPHIALVWRKKWAAGEVWENYYVFPATFIFMVVYSIWREIRIYTGITELQVWMYVFTPSTI